MPIAFRCPKCRNKLSTAKRKAGTLVACPNCKAEVRVPTAADKLDPQVERLLAATGSVAGGGTETVTPEVEVEPLPAPPPPIPMARPAKPVVAGRAAKPVPSPAPRPVKLNDLPLFEREDFAEMLEKDAESDADETPLPLPSRSAPPTTPADGFVVTRGTAIMVLVSVVVLLGLAFTAGFLVGNRG
jgi:hypothetical protein